jgi:UDP-glucose 4-epimerase
MKVLLTGATGFIGRHLARELSPRHQIYCITRSFDEELQDLGCLVIQTDLQYPLNLNVLPDQVDAVVHLASVNPASPDQANESFKVTVASTQYLLDYGRKAGIRHFVYASSGSVYGFGERPWKEEDPAQAMNFYAVHKRCAELLVNSYAQFFSTCVLRLFFPYGPGQSSRRRIPMIIERIREGKSVTIFNDGKPKINPIYISDVVRIIEKALNLQGNFVVNVAGDQVVDMKQLALLIGNIIGRKPSFENIKDNATLDLIADNQRMHQLFKLGSLVSLEEGLKRMIST